MPHPRDSIIDDLNRKLDQFFGRGGVAQQIAQGVSGETMDYGAKGHQERLRIERARLAPEVRKHAESGLSSTQIAAAMSIRVKRVQMIAAENSIQIRGLP
ncbi:hypothetical protein [Pseudomonas sp. MRSN 12121]|uniref:hypothetical protein n=1 Tax=Pseudomonas sp. MRSN 12121 TaxID=1611770 RepID=UPI000698AB93|nr:hypothetical protein [Pseudomonas sp. MRSN 12121]